MNPDYPLWWGPIIGLATRDIREGYTHEQIVAQLERSPAYQPYIHGDEERIATLARQFYDLAQFVETACREGRGNSPECRQALAQQYQGESNYTQYGVKVSVTWQHPDGRQETTTVIVAMDTQRSINQLLLRVGALLQSGDIANETTSELRIRSSGATIVAFNVHDIRGGGYGNDIDVGLGESLESITTVRERLRNE